MTPNMNPTTGIRYGVIAGKSLDPELLNDLMFGSQAKNLTYEYCLESAAADARAAADEVEAEVDDLMHENGDADLHPRRRDAINDLLTEAAYQRLEYDDREAFIEDKLEDFNNAYQGEEEVFEGELDGVFYHLGWLGGAIIVFIYASPIITKGALCSPCVPGAVNMDSEGDYEGYGVPADWLAKEYT